MSRAISTLPVGAKVKHPETRYNGATIVWDILEHGHDGPANTSIVTDRIVSIKCFDAKEPNNTDANCKSNGNNNYGVSNLLSWLNSDQKNWYTAKHAADQAPSSTTYTDYNPYSDEAGFLAGFHKDFKAILQGVTHVVAKNTVTDGGGSESITSRIYLLSTTEVGLANENNIAEGKLYTFFQTAANRLAIPTPQAVAKSTYKTGTLNDTQPWWYWLRTPFSGNSCSVRDVYTNGNLTSGYAYDGGAGVRPACVIPSTTLVSDSPDADGAYIIMFNESPKVHTDTALGDKNGAFDVSFSVTDAENEDCTAGVTLETGTQSITLMETAPIELSHIYTVNVSQTQLTALEIGKSYKIRITVTDSHTNVTVTDVTFTRSASTVIISGADADLGNKWNPFTQGYTVTDTDVGTTLTATEKIDDTLLRQYMPVAGAANAVDLENVWPLLQNEAEHTLTISVTNSSGATAVRTYTFTKLGSRLQWATKPMHTDLAARSILVMAETEATGSQTVLIEACNDAASGNPTWEDITDAVQAGNAYMFQNKPADGFAVSVRVTQTKGADCERVYSNALGFAIR